ncbi:unnamed protein product [Polarella glacialis]|uniref:Uncharacterized protein n=1 Tax=Polarella glacialis TaxID=89957 RepID=A0A813G2X7_POLGL|nr:unnamed protein product [Polarella glacialis]
MTGEEPAEASYTQAVQMQDPLTPSNGTVAVGGAANKICQCLVEGEMCDLCGIPFPWQSNECCYGRCGRVACETDINRRRRRGEGYWAVRCC